MTLQVTTNLLTQLGQIRSAVVLGEFIIERGQHALVDLLDLRAPFHGLSRQLLLRIVGLVGAGGAHRFANFGAGQNFVESVRQRALGHFEQAILGLAGGKRLVADVPLDGCEHVVAIVDLFAVFDLLERALPFAQRAEGLVDLLVFDFDFGLGNFQPFIVLDRNFRTQIESRAEFERLVEIGFFGHDLRRDDRLEAVLFERLFGVFANQFLDHLAAHLVTEKSLQQIARGMPGAKTLQHDAAPQLVIGLVELAPDLVAFDFDGDFAPKRAGGLDIYLHGTRTRQLTTRALSDSTDQRTDGITSASQPHRVGEVPFSVRECRGFWISRVVAPAEFEWGRDDELAVQPETRASQPPSSTPCALLWRSAGPSPGCTAPAQTGQRRRCLHRFCQRKRTEPVPRPTFKWSRLWDLTLP